MFLPTYKYEPAQWIDGLHEALIDEKTFYEVQDVLAGRKKNPIGKYASKRNELPLRGFLIRPK